MAVLQRISEVEYRDLALHEQDGVWELWDGVPRKKPGMSFAHNDAAIMLGHVLLLQLDRRAYRVRVNAPQTRISPRNYFVPDVAVVPLAYRDGLAPRGLAAYAEPLPLVVEVWSPPTGDDDIEVKLRRYQERGDLEIWRLHPDERTPTAWRRRPDGTYVETTYTGGSVPVASLPGVAVDLDALLDD